VRFAQVLTMTISNKESLREEIQMLTFTLDGVLYGVNVHQVREVKNFEGVTPVPYAPAHVKGVTNLRGEVIPVVDLRRQFGVSAEKSDQEAGIMIIVQEARPVGVMVDSVQEVLTISKKDIEQNSEHLSTANSGIVLGVAKHDKRLIILLDLMKVITKVD
jgi:purine-binding chemotaxis protein CheW